MTFVITQPCCNDASCVAACPVNCIHPAPDEPTFMTIEMLYIDPATCIDCGACVEECPVDAILPDLDLTAENERYLGINAAYYERYPMDQTPPAAMPPKRRVGDFSKLRVAVVGSGPAAHYAAIEILHNRGAEVDMFDRLHTPYGLVRLGVAPDHPGTKAVTDEFRRIAGKATFHLHLGVEIGSHITHDELMARYSAVVYAVGASNDRRLGIPGEDLPGSYAATEFVAWYNGHPDFADASFDLSGERAVIVGNGNVALDVARILVSDPNELAKTDMADYAVEALRKSNIREVVVLGRRGPAQAGYSTPELYALLHLPGVDVVIDDDGLVDELTQNMLDAGTAPVSVHLKTDLAKEIAALGSKGSERRIILRYMTSPLEIEGTDKVTGVRVVHNSLELDDDGNLKAVSSGVNSVIETSLVLRSIGYRGTGVPGVPFDDKRAIIPNADGRVLDPTTGETVPGVYAAGWIKRGPTGVIGTNKQCAADTVDVLLDDFDAGIIVPVDLDRAGLAALVAERSPDSIDSKGWTLIDKAEKAAGKERGKPRLKIVDTQALIETARG